MYYSRLIFLPIQYFSAYIVDIVYWWMFLGPSVSTFLSWVRSRETTILTSWKLPKLNLTTWLSTAAGFTFSSIPTWTVLFMLHFKSNHKMGHLWFQGIQSPGHSWFRPTIVWVIHDPMVAIVLSIYDSRLSIVCVLHDYRPTIVWAMQVYDSRLTIVWTIYDFLADHGKIIYKSLYD